MIEELRIFEKFQVYSSKMILPSFSRSEFLALLILIDFMMIFYLINSKSYLDFISWMLLKLGFCDFSSAL